MASWRGSVVRIRSSSGLGWSGLVWGVLLLLGVTRHASARPIQAMASERPAASSLGEPEGGQLPLVQDRLPNGLRVLLLPRTGGAPLVSLSIVYGLPVTSPSIRSVAFSQLFSELLPTLGTPHLTAAARRQLLLAADTDFERRRVATGLGDLVLSFSVLPDALELALFIEADRMGFAPDALTQTDIDEAAARLRHSASAQDELLQAWLDDTVVGSCEALSSAAPWGAGGHFALADVQQQMRRYLQPGNATLVMEGALEPRSALQAIGRTLGRLRGRGLKAPVQAPYPDAPRQCAIEGDHGQQYLLSWRVPACSTAGDCPLAVLAEGLPSWLGVGTRQCARVWVTHPWESQRFTVGCEPGSDFDTLLWTEQIATAFRNVIERPPTLEALHLAFDQFAVHALSPLSFPEWQAAVLARQVAIGQVPSLTNFTQVASSLAPDPLTAAIKRHLIRPADSTVETRTRAELRSRDTLPKPVSFADASPVVQNVDESTWYRPARKGKSASVAFPDVNVRRLAGNLILRHLEKRGEPISRVALRFILRDADADPALAQIAAYQLLQAEVSGTSLINRLWREGGVRATWDADSNSLSMRLTGTQERIDQSLQLLRDALQTSLTAFGSLDQAKRAVVSRLGAKSNASLLDQLQARVGSPLAADLEPRRLLPLQVRLNGFGPKQVAQFWATYANRSELNVAIIGPHDLGAAERAAALVVPPSWQRANLRSRSTWVVAPRIWILDDADLQHFELEVLWPSRNTLVGARVARALAGVSSAAKAFGNLNAARPRNPTTQFVIEHTSLARGQFDRVAVHGIDMARIETVLRELEGYFLRLTERVDFPQLASVGVHDIQRKQLAWFTSPSRTLDLLDDWGLSGAVDRYFLDDFESVGPIARERLVDFAQSLTLDRATIIARGPASKLEGALRTVNHGQCLVVLP